MERSEILGPERVKGNAFHYLKKMDGYSTETNISGGIIRTIENAINESFKKYKEKEKDNNIGKAMFSPGTMEDLMKELQDGRDEELEM